MCCDRLVYGELRKDEWRKIVPSFLGAAHHTETGLRWLAGDVIIAVPAALHACWKSGSCTVVNALLYLDISLSVVYRPSARRIFDFDLIMK